MAVIIGSARINELNEKEGGQPGDQNGREVATENWYLHSKGWVVIRAKDPSVRAKIAQNMRYICANDNIGYSYWNACYGLLNESKKYGYDASKVKVKCDTNCAKSVVCCIRYAGVNVDDFYTGIEVEVCKKTNAFHILTDSKYCASSDYLLEGDILVTKTSGHTVVVLTDGPKAKEYLPYLVWNCAYCNMRKGPSINYGVITALSSGTVVNLHDWASSGWGYVEVDGRFGYISPMYLAPCNKAIVSGGSTWLRNKPGKDVGAKIVSISAGTIVHITGKTSMVGKTTWYEVVYNGHQGWASGLYVKPIK